jgi:hypothetical protein
MKKIGLVAVVLILIGVMVFLNRGISINNQTAQSAPPATAPAKKPAVTTPDAMTPPLPPVQIIGDPITAHNKITVGWEYDTVNQANHQALNNALQAVVEFAQHHKNTSAIIADMDIPNKARALPARAVKGVGVSLNGKPLKGLQDNPGEGSTVAPAIGGALYTIIH